MSQQKEQTAEQQTAGRGANPWVGKRVLITGVCGTVGGELLRQILTRQPAEVVGLDNNESELFLLQDELREDSRVQLYLCDIRERERLR